MILLIILIWKKQKWISKAVNDNYKVLGICLGAQLIADALDGKAYLSDNIEFGFKKLEFLDTNLFLKISKILKSLHGIEIHSNALKCVKLIAKHHSLK